MIVKEVGQVGTKIYGMDQGLYIFITSLHRHIRYCHTLFSPVYYRTSIPQNMN